MSPVGVYFGQVSVYRYAAVGDNDRALEKLTSSCQAREAIHFDFPLSDFSVLYHFRRAPARLHVRQGKKPRLPHEASPFRILCKERSDLFI